MWGWNFSCGAFGLSQEIVCQLGNEKGKVSRFYFLKGLKKLLIAQSVLQFKENNGISDELWAEMNAFAGIGE